MLLQRLATGATGVKQARYRRGPTRGSEALYAHAQYNTQHVGPWYNLHGVMPAYEFRRGFCTLCFHCFVCVCICLSVCPSVTALAASASAYTCSQRYSGVCLRLFLDKYVWNFEKNFRSRVIA